jgi:hypothetical protein
VQLLENISKLGDRRTLTNFYATLWIHFCHAVQIRGNFISFERRCFKIVQIQSKTNNTIKELSIIQQVFGGTLQSTVKCTRCKSESRTIESFLDISLEMGKGDTLEKALALFTKSELLTNGNRYRCNK